MDFYEFEEKMNSLGVKNLADIARLLNTTPQAVSNWKSRNQVPYHVIAKINQTTPKLNMDHSQQKLIEDFKENSISLSDILVKLAEQFKVIILTTFLSVFITFTFTMFIQKPQYESTAKLLLPKKLTSTNPLGGIASQFGISVPNDAQSDLSNKSLLPELMNSRLFSKKMLEREFYTKKFDKTLPLYLIILNNQNNSDGEDTLINLAVPRIKEMLHFENSSSFSILKSVANEPQFAKELAEAALMELELLNRYFKSQSVNEKINFINQRISAVGKDLNSSEIALKNFQEKNRQISSPSLELELERLEREVKIQNQVFVTLKQQLELAKIEEVQEQSVFQILDYPELPLRPSNRNFLIDLFRGLIIGTFFGVLLSLVRSYINSDDINERKKIRKVRSFLKKKTKEFYSDHRISGILSFALLIGMPFYLIHKSSNPVYFGRFSPTLLIVNIVYISLFILSLFNYIKLMNKKNG